MTSGAIKCFPEDINNNGQIVGWCESSDGTRQAFLWESGSIMALGGLSGKPYSSSPMQSMIYVK